MSVSDKGRGRMGRMGSEEQWLSCIPWAGVWWVGHISKWIWWRLSPPETTGEAIPAQEVVIGLIWGGSLGGLRKAKIEEPP